MGFSPLSPRHPWGGPVVSGKQPRTPSLIPQALIKRPLRVTPSILQGTEDAAESKTARFLLSREFTF